MEAEEAAVRDSLRLHFAPSSAAPSLAGGTAAPEAVAPGCRGVAGWPAMAWSGWAWGSRDTMMPTQSMMPSPHSARSMTQVSRTSGMLSHLSQGWG